MIMHIYFRNNIIGCIGRPSLNFSTLFNYIPFKAHENIVNESFVLKNKVRIIIYK